MRGELQLRSVWLPRILIFELFWNSYWEKLKFYNISSKLGFSFLKWHRMFGEPESYLLAKRFSFHIARHQLGMRTIGNTTNKSQVLVDRSLWEKLNKLNNDLEAEKPVTRCIETWEKTWRQECERLKLELNKSSIGIDCLEQKRLAFSAIN